MTIPLTFKKLGDRWYLDVEHKDPKYLNFGKVIDRAFNILDKYDSGTITVKLISSEYLDDKHNLIQFTEDDILKYFTTNHEFWMDLYIGKHKFKLASCVYTAIEKKYDADFHILAYYLNIINETDY